MSQLTIDQGNSLTKLSFFQKSGLAEHYSLTDSELFVKLDSFLDKWKPTSAILSSVRVDSLFLEEKIRTACKLVLMSNHLIFPFGTAYATPETVGTDRLANAAGAVKRFPEKPVLIVDFGSCNTYTLVTNNIFRGGTIAPGIHMRYRAMHEFTGRLPSIQPITDFPELIGTSTENSMRSGVERAVIAETDALIGQYCSQIPDLIVLITGGSMGFFEKHLKSPIFALPYLTPEGLHEILLLNDI